MSKSFKPTKTSAETDYPAKCPQKAVLHLRDDPTEFDMLPLKSWAEQDLMLQ